MARHTLRSPRDAVTWQVTDSVGATEREDNVAAETDTMLCDQLVSDCMGAGKNWTYLEIGIFIPCHKTQRQ